MAALNRCHNIEDVRRVARSKLPAPLFHYIDGGAEDEWSLRNNTAAFDRCSIMPHFLNDVSRVDISSSLFGAPVTMPLMLSPTGMSRLFHHEKELGVARAAAAAGLVYSLSTMATSTIEDVAAAGAGPKMFQIYLMRDRSVTRDFIQRCKAQNYTAMCLTVDTAIGGKREHDLRFGLTMPPKLSLSTLAQFTIRPGWSLHYCLDRNLDIANLAHLPEMGRGPVGPGGYVAQQLDRSANWDDLAWLVEQWGGPFVVKGLLSARDARRAADAGASAVMISNHGGRQLDHAPAPFDCVSAMRDAVGDALELIVDGGVRRGVDVLKALALGATACAIGRPYLYGLAAAGERGVTHVLDLFRDEIQRSLMLMGRSSLAGLSPRDIVFDVPPPRLPG